jgi:CRISPR/Cas system-associated exonuclease Cas4 (RecB family)
MNNTRNVIKGIRLKNKKSLDAQAIANAIEQGFLAKRRPDKEWVEKTTFAPSTIAYGHGTCARYWNIVFNGLATYVDNTDAMGVANMSLGSVFHDEIQSAMQAAGLLVESEREIKIEDPPIRGYLDAIIKWGDEEIVGEIKTTRQESFVFKETSGKPSANHLIQLLIYLKATGLQRGFLLYVNKNDQTFLVIPVELDDENEKIIGDVFEWLRTVRKAFDEKLLPQRPFRKSSETGLPSNKICRGCPVQAMCFNNLPEGDVLIPLMEVPKL